MKQETLEEVASKFAKDHYEMYETSNLGSMHFGFYWGAKWQQERMYSEEEVWNICSELASYFIGGDTFDLKEWFEQFKKK